MNYQLFPGLPPAVESALRASIRRFGVIVPIVCDQHGQVLDGHHRKRIADELGVEYRVDTVVVADDAEAAAIVETLNTDRGHRLKSDMRREIEADLRGQGHSFRAIAGAMGVNEITVRRDLVSTATDVAVPDRITGLDGKSRPAHRIASSVTKDGVVRMPQEERARQIGEAAAEGCLASQIADRLGISEERIRQLARDTGVVLPNAAIGKQRRHIDINQIMGETATTLAGLALGIETLVGEDVNNIDQEQARYWAESIGDSLRVLNRLYKQLTKGVIR